jgi:hypothetical protein
MTYFQQNQGNYTVIDFRIPKTEDFSQHSQYSSQLSGEFSQKESKKFTNSQTGISPCLSSTFLSQSVSQESSNKKPNQVVTDNHVILSKIDSNHLFHL